MFCEMWDRSENSPPSRLVVASWAVVYAQRSDGNSARLKVDGDVDDR